MILARQSIFAHVFFIGIFAILLLVPLLASAANPTTSFLVPEGCKTGCPCTLCDLYTLGSNVINFALYALSVPIAAAMFLYGGVKLVTSGGNPGARTSAKSIMVNAVVGMALAFFAWLFINTLLITLTFQINFVQGLKMWNETPTCQSGGGETCNVTGFVVPDTQTASGSCLAGNLSACSPDQQGFINGTRCPGRQPNEPPGEGCSLNPNAGNAEVLAERLTPYQQFILEASQKYGVSPERIMAIIGAESSADPTATHTDLDGKSSYGLMQIRPDTARLLNPEWKNLSDADIAARLQDPATNIDLGTKYYKDLLNRYGNDTTLASAAYNGGPGANLPSQNCPGLRRWQCEWDNNAHTLPNDRPGHPGYGPTRRYTDNVNNLEGAFRNQQSTP